MAFSDSYLVRLRARCKKSRTVRHEPSDDTMNYVILWKEVRSCVVVTSEEVFLVRVT